MKKLLGLIATAAITLSITNTAYAKNDYNVNRLYGDNRYKTSISISNNFSSGTIQNVIVANGQNFADALAGSVLSKKLNAPIVLSDGTVSNSSDSIDYIKNHLDKNGTIYILGGSASISNDFVNYMKQQGYNNIQRLGGTDRFGTNKAIVDFMNAEKGTPVVIANAYGFADALSVSSIAASKGYPIIMTSDAALSNDAMNMIKNINPSQVYIIGGYASVGTNVINQVKNLLPTLDSSKMVTLAGNDRYQTSMKVCNYFNLDTDTAVIANGSNFPDALSGSALATKLNAPIVLTNGQDISTQRDFLDSRSFKNIILLGGFGAIDFPIEYSLKGSDNVTADEKNFINSLSDYCKQYTDYNTNMTNKYENTIPNEISYAEGLLNTNDPNELLNGLDYFSQILEEGKNDISSYKQELVTLRDNASNLQDPSDLEPLKDEFINNINIEINSADKALSFANSYIDGLNSFKEAFKSMDINRIEQEASNFEKLSSNNLDELQDTKSIDEAINNLNDKLVKIKNSIQ